MADHVGTSFVHSQDDELRFALSKAAKLGHFPNQRADCAQQPGVAGKPKTHSQNGAPRSVGKKSECIPNGTKRQGEKHRADNFCQWAG